jgi:hypothetical protein
MEEKTHCEKPGMRICMGAIETVGELSLQAILEKSIREFNALLSLREA